ncbi:MAG TPA: glycosyltransferase, partial [Bacteroidales bacterium]|nr:glycosyltransferase [Bacteroidales bacterium]
DTHPEAGCLGVKMIDGKGHFLPESKRALPEPMVAFYKVFGLSALFPRSRRFGKYHLGYLDMDKIHEVDVISGAFMFIRRNAIEKTGLLDERFFMYGEDIDLSYRFNQAGFKNIYFPGTTIIHYKGESTRKGSINYVMIFYKAMIIFARKHFKQSTYRFYSFIIHLAIYFRAGLSLLSRFIGRIITPLLDVAFTYIGYYYFMPLWERQHFGNAGAYPPEYMRIMVPGYIAIWILCIFITTGYEKKVKFTDLVRGVLTGTLIILVVYALLPEDWRFSRALIILGTLWVLVSTFLIRYLLHSLNKNVFSFEIFKKKKRILIIGDKLESNRVYSIVKQTHVVPELIGFVNPGKERADSDFVGNLSQIEDIVRVNQADELIFCASSVSSEMIIRTMLQFTATDVEFKIAPPESLSVIGSSSNDTAGELYVLHFNTLSRIQNKRKKRLFDIVLSLLLIPASPFLIFLVRNKGGFIRNIFSVMFGINSWVGYYKSTGGEHPGLPEIKQGILTPFDMNSIPADSGHAEQLNLSYAKDYRIRNDIKILINHIPLLGRRPVVDYAGRN